MNGTVPGSKPYRDRLRAELAGAGVTGRCLTEQVAADLARQGMRPRSAWRYASELSQRVTAMRFNEVTGDPRAPMTSNRIWDFERWPSGGVRPTVRTLRILACIYGTTWDLLVDAADLAYMPAADRAAYAKAASGRARVTGTDPPPPAEEIHIWMATADRITRYVTIPRRQATLPVLMSVLRGLVGEPGDDSPERLTGISDRTALARRATAGRSARLHPGLARAGSPRLGKVRLISAAAPEPAEPTAEGARTG